MSALSSYRVHDTVPTDLVLVPGGRHRDADTPANAVLRENNAITKWSGVSLVIPAIGEPIRVTMNGIGDGTVTGYFTEHGWFGLLVKPRNPPAWYVKQNGRGTSCHVFGNECAPPVIRPAAALRLASRTPPGPHYMPVGPEYRYELIHDGSVVARTKYDGNKTRAYYAALALGKRKGYRVITDERSAGVSP